MRVSVGVKTRGRAGAGRQPSRGAGVRPRTHPRQLEAPRSQRQPAPAPAPLAVEGSGPLDDRAAASAGEIIVAREARRYRTWRLERADLRQAGMVGVAEAVARFRPERGRFGAYAAHWVRKEMQRALASGEFAASIPADYPGRAVALRAVLRDVGGDADRAAERLGLPADVIHPLMAIVDARTIDELLQDDNQTMQRLADTLLVASPEDDVADELQRQAVHRAIGTLDVRQRRAVVLRFGLDGGGERSQREIARQLGVSDFTIRAVLAKAVQALRLALAAYAPDNPSPTEPLLLAR